MPIKSIDRISMPDDDTFYQEYIFKRKPVIITNLFEGDEIRRIKSLEDAKKAFGQAKLRIQNEYSYTGPRVDQMMTFNEYWDFVQANPSTDLLCAEDEVPACVMALFKLPTVCLARDLKEEEILKMPRKYGDHDLFPRLFIANRGNSTHLHWDGDHRQVFLYQVFGRKEVILFQPESGAKLKSFDHQHVAYSGLSLEHMTEEQKHEFVDLADGYMGTIYPGDAIYMPMLIWHYLGYMEDAMSFSMRFGRNKYGRFLCIDNFHRDDYVQNFASNLADKRDRERLCKEAIDSVITEYIKPRTAKVDKVKDMRKLFKDLCVQLAPEFRPEEYCPPEREQEEIDKIMRDLGTMCYEDPNVVAQTRPAGAISQVQKELIEKNALKCGYSRHELQRLLLNSLGKPQIDLLTKVEASRFLLYMKSPGSLWLH
jgi:hypothetical protein